MNNDYDNVTSIENLLFYILTKWRTIIIFCVVFTILAGALVICQNKIDENKDYSEIYYEIEKNENKLASLQEYYDNSVLMKIDPYNKYMFTIQFIIGENSDASDTQIKNEYGVYNSYILRGGLYDDLLPEISYLPEEKYFNEMVAIAFNSESQFTVTVSYYNQNEGSSIATKIGEKIIEFSESRGEEALDLTLVGTRNTISIDTGLYNNQTGRKTTIETIETDLENLELSLTQDRSIIKNMFIGLLLGFFISVLLIICKYIFSNRVRAASELRLKYKIKILGILNVNKDSDYKNVIDAKIHKNRSSKLIGKSYEEQFDILCFYIQEKCSEAGINHVLLMADDYGKEVADKLKESFKDSNLMLETTQNDLDTIEKLKKTNHIIVLVKLNKSYDYDVKKYMEMSCNSNSEILGTIVIE